MNSITEMQTNGIFSVDNFFTAEEVSLLKDEACGIIQDKGVYDVKSDPDTHFDKLIEENKFTINRRMKSRDGDEGLIDIWNYNYGMSMETRIILDRLNKHVSNMLNQAYPDAGYRVLTQNLYVNNSVTQTRGIHSDSLTFPSRWKSFLYLTDIPDLSYGPFSYVLKSHMGAGRKYYGKVTEGLATPITEDDKKNYKIYTNVKAGDVIVASVAGAHRGIPQEKNRVRMVLVTSYDPDENRYESNHNNARGLEALK